MYDTTSLLRGVNGSFVDISKDFFVFHYHVVKIVFWSVFYVYYISDSILDSMARHSAIQKNTSSNIKTPRKQQTDVTLQKDTESANWTDMLSIFKEMPTYADHRPSLRAFLYFYTSILDSMARHSALYPQISPPQENSRRKWVCIKAQRVLQNQSAPLLF